MKVLIVDDHPIVRAGLRRLLTAEPGTTVVEAESGQKALGLFRDDRPTLVVLDLNLPGIGGFEVLSRLMAEDPKARVLVVSMYDNPVYVARVLAKGACGYVSKNSPSEEILEAVRRVGAGRRYVDREMAQQLAVGDYRGVGHTLDQLSTRDIEILRLLGDGASLTEIARAIGISYKTVANHCSRLKAELAAPRMADLIRLAIASGLTTGSPNLPANPE